MTAVLEPAPELLPPIDMATITAAFGCPTWCELPADHDLDTDSLDRAHRAAIFEIPGKVEISVYQSVWFDNEGIQMLRAAAEPPEAEIFVGGTGLTDEQCVQVVAALQRMYAKLAEITGQAAR
jgi:hypothetical protein